MKVYAPTEGKLIDITEVKDPVFSDKVIGDGMAISPTDDLVCSPIEGTIETIFPTNHAFIVKSGSGIQVLVHIGLDTVELKGKPFTRLKNVGNKVKSGEPIIKSNYKLILKNKLDPTVIVVVSNYQLKNKSEIDKNYKIGDIIFEVAD